MLLSHAKNKQHKKIGKKFKNLRFHIHIVVKQTAENVERNKKKEQNDKTQSFVQNTFCAHEINRHTFWLFDLDKTRPKKDITQSECNTYDSFVEIK